METTPVRPTLNPHDLVQLLNWELAAYEECGGCRFTSIRRMADVADSGSNWRDARVQSDHPLGTEERSIIREVIEQTRREFNVD
jgi:hypothetical protein